MNRTLAPYRFPVARRTQGGVVLFVALIAMVILSLAGVALVRAIDSSTGVAGNLAFRQSSIAPVNLAIEKAVDATKDATQPRSSPEGGIVMQFLIDGSEGGPLSQQAMRRLVEVVDGYRGQAEVFVVYRDSFPYQAV
ncbi:MAG: hypothetical protein ABI593_11945, partial [Betaproteobacteria bacterium]